MKANESLGITVVIQATNIHKKAKNGGYPTNMSIKSVIRLLQLIATTLVTTEASFSLPYKPKHRLEMTKQMLNNSVPIMLGVGILNKKHIKEIDK